MNKPLIVYWCPRCEVQSERLHHFCKQGPPLFPQLDEYTLCEQIEVVPKHPNDEERYG